jgi:hypothetical protein
MRGPLTFALVVASLSLAGTTAVRAECKDAPCSPECESPTVVNAHAPNVIVEVPPPNIIIRAVGQSECVERECFIKRCCHLCRPCYVQPTAPVYSVQAAAPIMYQQAPVAYQQAPVAFQQAPVAYQQAPVAYQQAPVAFQQAPVAYQQAPVAFQQAPVSFQAAPVSFQAAPISFQAAPVSFQAAPVAAPVNFTLTQAAPAAPAAPVAPVSPESGMDCNQALRKITKQVETLTAAVDQHSDYLTVHEKRLNKIEKFLDGMKNGDNKFSRPAKAEDLDEKEPIAPPKR